MLSRLTSRTKVFSFQNCLDEVMTSRGTLPLGPTRKRSGSDSPPPWHRPNKNHRRLESQAGPHEEGNKYQKDDGLQERKKQETFAREQTRLNQIQEAEQMREWVSKEDDFVLRQSKKKAQIRVKEGRANSIDWLAVTLSIIDTTKDPLEDDSVESNVDIVDPAGIFEGLSHFQLLDLGKEIDTYLMLESNKSNRDYWNVCIPTLNPT